MACAHLPVPATSVEMSRFCTLVQTLCVFLCACACVYVWCWRHLFSAVVCLSACLPWPQHHTQCVCQCVHVCVCVSGPGAALRWSACLPWPQAHTLCPWLALHWSSHHRVLWCLVWILCPFCVNLFSFSLSIENVKLG